VTGARLTTKLLPAVLGLALILLGTGLLVEPASARLEPASQQAKPRHKPKKHKPTPKPATPNTLAKRIVHATSADKRYEALLAAMQQMHVGVMNGRGHRLGGASTKNAFFYLYDFDLTALANSFKDGDRFSLDQVAAILGGLGEQEAGAAPSGAGLANIIVTGYTRVAAKPKAPDAFLAELFRQLGRERGVDVTALDPSKPELDGLQTWLILYDVLVPQVASSLNSGASSRELSGTVRANDVCDDNWSGNTSAQASATGWLLGLAFGTPKKIGQIAASALLGDALAYSITINELHPDANRTHFGHDGPGSGAPMHLQVVVDMQDHYPDEVIACGAMAGVHIPKYGGIPGVKVDWTAETGNLRDYGQLSCGNAGACTTTTDDNGIATLDFQPDYEDLPGIGFKYSVIGVAGARAYPQLAAGSTLGVAAEALGLVKYAAVGWTVELHQPPPLKIDKLSVETTTQEANGYTQRQKTWAESLENCASWPTAPPGKVAQHFKGGQYYTEGWLYDSSGQLRNHIGPIGPYDYEQEFAYDRAGGIFLGPAHFSTAGWSTEIPGIVGNISGSWPSLTAKVTASAGGGDLAPGDAMTGDASQDLSCNATWQPPSGQLAR